MLRLIFVTDATAAGRLWSIRQNHPESGSDVLNVYHRQQRVYEETSGFTVRFTSLLRLLSADLLAPAYGVIARIRQESLS